VSLPGFPNFFMLLGPHSPVGNYSLTALAETQAGYILDWIQRWRRREFDTAAPTQAATDKFNAEMLAAMPNTVWATGCTRLVHRPRRQPRTMALESRPAAG